MKKVLFLFVALISFGAMSQTEPTNKSSVTRYVSLGVSISNVDTTKVAESAFPSIELGLCYKNVTLGLSGGTNSFNTRKPWFELKSTFAKEIGSVNLFGVLGTGITINEESKVKSLIEYGVGFSYSVKHLTYSVQGSNWYGTWYVSPAITYNF